MQHFMKHHIIECQPRNVRLIEDAADDDGVVAGIEVSEARAGPNKAPTNSGTGHESMEMQGIESLEYFDKVIEIALGTAAQFAPTLLPDQLRAVTHVATVQKKPVSGLECGGRLPSKQLGEKDKGQGFRDWRGRRG